MGGGAGTLVREKVVSETSEEETRFQRVEVLASTVGIVKEASFLFAKE